MSRARKDPSRAKQRREKLRREAHAAKRQAGAPGGLPPAPARLFASERSLRAIHALLGDRTFESEAELDRALQSIMSRGSILDKAEARMGSDPAWAAQNLAYDAMETGSYEEALILVLQALELDPDCTDALRLMVTLTPITASEKIPLVMEVLKKFEAKVGEEFFKENAGHFWGIIETRPYMRTMQYLAELYTGLERFDEAIRIYERMIELNSRDNQGARDDLVGLYLAAGRAEAANALLGRFKGEETVFASAAWARVMERWMSGQTGEAAEALASARALNPYVHGYLTGARRLPKKMPDYFETGGEEEAQITAFRLQAAVRLQPGFLAWLRTHPL